MDAGVNSFTGELPTWLGSLPQLEQLILRNNSFSGRIPSSLFNNSKLQVLRMSFNLLGGNIPKEIGSSSSLKIITLAYNQLSASLTGSLPSDMCNNMPKLNTLSLSSNQLSGEIPPNIWKCRELELLRLSVNHFSGNIPREIGSLSRLGYLELGMNDFEGGVVPPEIGNLSRLEILSIGGASLTGDIPSSIFNISSLTLLDFGNNSLSGSIPTFHNLPKLEALYLNNNKLTELERGTTSFSESNLLGRGSFGSVFKAALCDGLIVAVKVFNLQLEGATRSFDTETEILSNIRHRNLVRVIGCCSNTEFKALILTYMPNGSLEKWLYSNIYCLDLMQRLKIAIDVALALEYLHHGYTFPVVHCDIKPSNVLLDRDMVAHLGDFGVSKLFDGGQIVIQTQTLATIGYAAPEYGMEGKVSTNGDVYSFGIMVLEIFTGKKPTDDMFSGEMSLKEWVSEALQENAATEIVALTLLSREDHHFSAKEQCVSSIFNLAMKCLAVLPEERINMIEAVAALQKIKTTVVAGIGRPRQYQFSVNILDNGF
ncbi:hypothetical protein C2S52_018762 [Perilla frutescens var. hirtella]|nr:hypothetical protein C2S52_018762 [Perilla frutescens var. hirtella]